MKYSEAGKEHFRRPSKVPYNDFEKRWEDTFKTNKKDIEKKWQDEYDKNVTKT